MVALVLVCQQAVKDQCDASRVAGAVVWFAMQDAHEINAILDGRYAELDLLVTHCAVVDDGRADQSGCGGSAMDDSRELNFLSTFCGASFGTQGGSVPDDLSLF